MHLRYYVPFKAQEGVSAEYALKEKLINIEGVAIDTSVNANKWQVPDEDLDFFTETLKNAQLRADHAESVFMVVGKVPEAKRQGQEVYFRAEVGGEEKLIDKILRGYVKYVSVQVDSDDVECSKCKRPTRKEGILIHLCPGAWEIVHKPKVRELSIVASPAYEKTVFKPVGFYAAMNEGQWDAIIKSVTDSRSLDEGDDVGSNREVQEPEKEILDKQTEVKHMSVKADKDASPHQAQGVVNVAPGETAPKQVEYQDLMNQLQQLEKQIREGHPSASDSEIDALNKKIGELEAELAKRGTKRQLSKKLSDLTKQLQQPEEEEGEEAEEAKKGEGAEAEAKKVSGKGIVAVDEISKDMLGNYDWFKDLLKAHKKLVGFQ